MADSKITGLAALTTADPANDMLPIVDVSDNSMAASGTTKRISINNILACSPSATLASATISGAATVGTTLGVTGVSTFAAGTALLPALTTTGDTNTGIYYPAADTFAVTTAGVERYRVDSAGLIGVGGTPITSHFITAYGPICVTGTVGGTRTSYISNANTGSIYYTDGGASYPFDNFGNLIIQPRTSDARSVIIATGSTTPVERLVVNGSGNVGISVTPITSHILSCAGPVGITGTTAGTRTSYITNSSAASIYYTDGGGSGYFTDFGNLIIQPRTSAARSVVIATGSTTPVERAVVKSTGQVRFVPLAADPAGAEAGDVYYNSSSNKLKCYNGTTWNDLF